MILIIPTILSDSLSDIQQKLDRLHAETKLTRVQIDITDPDFIHELTVSPIDLTELTTYDLQIDIHLMTNDPINDVIECSQVPGIHEVIAQIEHMSSEEAFIDHVKSFDLKVGLSLDYTTPVESIDRSLIHRVDTLQVVDVQEGAQGRSFGGAVVIQEIQDVRSLIDVAGQSKIECMVDGGITEETARECLAAGADVLVVGSFLWKSHDLASAIAKLSSLA
jgi:ribulose-phosphate 3-epimerase